MDVPPQEASRAARLRADVGDVRRHVARGVVINAAFLTALTVLGFLKGFVLAALIAPSEYGVWGILAATLGTLARLKQLGVSDKYIQQDEADQELAFQQAFTIEAVLNAALMAVLLAAVPIITVAYGHDELLLPGFVLCLVVPAVTLQAPIWVLYRRMQFVRQRTLQAIDPLVSLIVTVGLAIAGAGYWSFVAGTVAGAWATAAVAVAVAPFPLRLVLDRVTVRAYLGFSAPLAIAGLSGIVVAQSGVLLGDIAVGIAGVGALTLATTIYQLTLRVDAVVTDTLYPAICAVRDRTELLFESFVKSNRLALMWAMPFGFGMALFADDLVTFVIGERWEDAVVLLQVFGVVAAIGHLGFNWGAYFRAMGETRPIATVAVAEALAFLVVNVPLLFAYDLPGFAAGYLVTMGVSLALRGYYLHRIFGRFRLGRHAARALAPSIPALLLVAALRLVEGGERTAALAGAELALYVAASAAATYAFERDLLREAVGYLRRQR
ncbi:MAG TPA: oligosaccharide flippase family protein [Solirubrobacteraceae bacterium]|jgi:O-antigen/teichoic acid export membrane protein